MTELALVVFVWVWFRECPVWPGGEMRDRVLSSLVAFQSQMLWPGPGTYYVAGSWALALGLGLVVFPRPGNGEV